MKRILFKICVVVFALLFTSFTIWRLHLAHEVNAQLQAIRSAGLPTNGEELNAYYPAVPDDENAAIKMADAFALIANYSDHRSNEVNAIKLPQRKDVFTAEQTELIAGWCSMNSSALAQVREAIKLPHSRYPVDFSWGVGTLLPHLAELKTLTRITEFQALLDTNNATTSIQTILGMAHTLDTEPILISKLVRIAMGNIAAATLERRLNNENMNEAELILLEKLFTEAADTNQTMNGLIGERAIYIPYFRMSLAEANKLANSDDENQSEPSGPILPGRQPILFKFTGFFERDLQFFLQSMETNISLARNYPIKINLITNVEDQIYEVCGRYHYMLSGMFLPALGNATFKEAYELAQVRSSQTALAVERFRLAHGSLPEKLDDLVPQFFSAVPVDPFDGQPLRFHRLEKGYVIYSVGRDGHDNNGRERPANKKLSDQTEYDITFTVER